MFLIAVQPLFSTIRCKSLAASIIPLLPCPMFTRIPAGFPPRPTAPVTAAAPFPMSPPSQIPNRAQTRHTRHARVAATPIPSAICAQFPSHMGGGGCAIPVFQKVTTPSAFHNSTRALLGEHSVSWGSKTEFPKIVLDSSLFVRLQSAALTTVQRRTHL